MNRPFITIFLLFFAIASPLVLFAQNDTVPRLKTELSFRYSLQSPIYSINTPIDLALEQDVRYRSRFGLGIRYYQYKRWFAEYSLAFSQEGGAYKLQGTNANYIKNSILIGYSANHSKRIIFDSYFGVEANTLLNACFFNTKTNESENVEDYYKRFHLSFPVGVGFKTKVFKNYFFSCHTFLSFSPYKVSNETYIKVSQIIFPAFQFSVSRFIK